MTNSADPDQLASEEAYWSGSALFAKMGMACFAREGLRIFIYLNCLLGKMSAGYVGDVFASFLPMSLCSHVKAMLTSSWFSSVCIAPTNLFTEMHFISVWKLLRTGLEHVVNLIHVDLLIILNILHYIFFLHKALGKAFLLFNSP